MVSDQARKGAAYGKPKGASFAEGDQYQVLFRSDGFPDAGEKALIRLANSVQWKGGLSDAAFPASYALWPVEGGEPGVLAARLLDCGHDSLGRPHTLRVEAMYFGITEPHDSIEIAARYLAPDGWPAENWTGATDIRLITTDVRANEPWSSQTADLVNRLGRVPRLLVSSRGLFFDQGFDAIHAPGGVAGCPDVRRTDPGDIGSMSLRDASSMHGAVRSRDGRRIALAVFLAIIVGAAGGLAAGIRYEQTRQGTELQATEETIQLQERELQDFKTRLEAAGRDSLARESLLQELRAEQKAFQDYRQVLKEQDVISPAHLRARLRRLGEEPGRDATEAAPPDRQ